MGSGSIAWGMAGSRGAPVAVGTVVVVVAAAGARAAGGAVLVGEM